MALLQRKKCINNKLNRKVNKKMNFEESMEKLEEIADELENGKLNLEESLVKFEEGIVLSKKCSEIIENAEKKITILLNKDGKLEEEEFETN